MQNRNVTAAWDTLSEWAKRFAMFYVEDNGSITLDGEFTIDDLKKIVAAMESVPA